MSDSKKKTHKPRPEINNFNPYNRIKLNEYHQVQKNSSGPSESKQLRKKQRDLERLIHYDKLDPKVREQKEKELLEVRDEMDNRKKNYERQKRKEYFIDSKYTKIKMVEETKIKRMLTKNTKDREAKSRPLEELEKEKEELHKKLRYVKNFPKGLKYVSLFPTNELSEEAKQFQARIMEGIEQRFSKSEKQKNAIYKERGEEREDKRIQRDDFFILQDQKSQNQEEEEESQE